MSIQIPNLHTSNKSAVESSAEVFILRRKDANHAGVFYDRNGKRVAYGTGPVSKGDVSVAGTGE